MNGFLTSWFFELGRVTLLLSVMALLVGVTLRFARLKTPVLHRIAWCMVLLAGWLFVRMPVSIPWYDSIPVSAEEKIAVNLPEGPAFAPVPLLVPLTEDLEASDPAPMVELDTVELDTVDPTPAENLSARDAALSPKTSMKTPLDAVAPTPVDAPASAGGGIFIEDDTSTASDIGIAKIDWSVVLLSVWGLGIAITLLRWLLGYVVSIRRMSTALEPDEASRRQWQTLLKHHGVRREIPLRLTKRMGPLLCRWPDGYELVVPAELWESLGPAVRLSVLRHELAHYQRGDVWKSLLVRILALPHWFNPVAWWAVRRFEEAAEWACDEAAVRDDIRSTEYARTLLTLAESSLAAGSCHPSMSRLSLTTRVRRLVTFHDRKDSIMKKTTLAGLAVLLMMLCAVRVDLVAKTPTVAEKPTREAFEQVKPEEEIAELVTEPIVELVTESAEEVVEPEEEIADAPADEADTLAADEPDTPDSPEKLLLFDGKTFGQWKLVLETETSPERLKTAIDALIMIGRRGNMQAAAEAIASLMRIYGSNGPHAISQKIETLFRGNYREPRTVHYHIPYKVGIPVLCRELEEGNEKSRDFASEILRSFLRELKDTPERMSLTEVEAAALQKVVVGAFVKYAKSDAPKQQRLNILCTLVGQTDAPSSKIISEALTKSLEHVENPEAVFRCFTSSFPNSNALIASKQKGSVELNPFAKRHLQILAKFLESENPKVRKAAANTTLKCIVYLPPNARSVAIINGVRRYKDLTKPLSKETSTFLKDLTWRAIRACNGDLTESLSKGSGNVSPNMNNIFTGFLLEAIESDDPSLSKPGRIALSHWQAFLDKWQAEQQKKQQPTVVMGGGMGGAMGSGMGGGMGMTLGGGTGMPGMGGRMGGGIPRMEPVPGERPYPPALSKPAPKISVGVVEEGQPIAGGFGHGVDLESRMLGKERIFTVFVKNESAKTLTNVKVEFVTSPAMRITAASQGFIRGVTSQGKSKRRLYWYIKSLPPRMTRRFKAKCINDSVEMPAVCRVVATSAEGAKKERDFPFEIDVPDIPPAELIPLEGVLEKPEKTSAMPDREKDKW